jgi:hypothetical protein
MNAVVSDSAASRRRYLWLLVVFLVGVLVGWLLAPHGKSCGGSTPSAAAGGGAKMQGDAGEEPRDSGPLRKGRGDKPMGADSGSAPPGDKALGKAPSPAGSPSVPADQSLQHEDGNGTPANGQADPPPGQILKAADFRYDRTGLPRYAQSVSTTGSTLYHAADSANYHSTAAIITSSSFQDVVDWYKRQLPAGWSVQLVGDVGALAQQVSIANIMSTLAAATQAKSGAPAGTPQSAPPPGTANAANAQSIAMFAPPADAQGDPSVLVQQSKGGSVEITLSKDGTEP